MHLLRIIGRRLLALVVGVIPFKRWRVALRNKIDAWLIALYRPKIERFIANYPKAVRPEPTIEKIRAGASLARLNDGEFNLLLGKDKRAYQKLEKKLVTRLQQILKSDEKNILVGISGIYEFETLGPIWKKFIIRKGNRTLRLFDPQKTYYSGTISGLLWAKGEQFDRNVALFKSIWEDRRVLFVVGKKSRFFFVEELFGNIIEHQFVFAPAKNAFAEYETILNNVRQYEKDWLVLIALGPTATVLAFDLAHEGYHAIDLGQLPSIYHKTKFGERYPEDHWLRKETERRRNAIFK
ncbi:MAG: GT-D fold domain-containing glycosyltransferase [Pseudomonadota bacterium]|nr:GT-D fold domain-containing glycosyltransferase [Pseudomonadota bacterium]